MYLKIKFIQLFREDFDYRRNHMLLNRKDTKVSEKSYSSYCEARESNYQTNTQAET